MKLNHLVLAVLLSSAPAVAQDSAPIPSSAQAMELQNAGKFAEAEAAWAARRAADPTDGEATFNLAYSLHMAGKLKEAHDMHLEATAFAEFTVLANYNHACVHALWNEPDPAFEALDVAVARGFRDSAQLAGDSDLANLREDARWSGLVERVAAAEAPQPAAEAPEAPALKDLPNERRMDFFLGTWTVTAKDAEPGQTSRAEVASIFDGAGLRSSMFDASKEKLRTEATYFPTEDGWRMLWINSEGQSAQLEGELKGGRMIFDLVSMNGEPASGSRAVFGKVGEKGFTYRWQTRGDDKKWTDAQTWRYQ